MVLGLAGFAGGVAALWIRPAVALRPHTVRTGDAPCTVRERFRRQLEVHGDIVATDGQRIVARFAGEAGMFRYHTVELVSFLPDAVTFEHLRGPFNECRERFHVTPRAGGGSVVTHDRTFTMRLGLLGWLLGVTVVRPTFERHVAAHMAQHLSTDGRMIRRARRRQIRAPTAWPLYGASLHSQGRRAAALRAAGYADVDEP